MVLSVALVTTVVVVVRFDPSPTLVVPWTTSRWNDPAVGSLLELELLTVGQREVLAVPNLQVLALCDLVLLAVGELVWRYCELVLLVAVGELELLAVGELEVLQAELSELPQHRCGRSAVR